MFIILKGCKKVSAGSYIDYLVDTEQMEITQRIYSIMYVDTLCISIYNFKFSKLNFLSAKIALHSIIQVYNIYSKTVRKIGAHVDMSVGTTG